MGLNLPNFMLGKPSEGIYGAFSKAQMEHQNLMGKELENIFNRIRNETAPQKNQADIAKTIADTGLVGQQTKWYGPKAEADVNLHNAQAGHHGASTQEIMQKIGMNNHASGLPDNGVPFSMMGVNERLQASKDITAQQKFSQGQMRVNKIAQEMQRLIDAHPNLADDFAASIVNAGEKPSLWSNLKRTGVNKKDLAAFEKFNKLSNDLILQQGESMGRNFTDTKAAILQQSKPNPANTDEANKYLINKILEDTSPAEAYHAALEKGRKGRYVPTLNMEAYRIQPLTSEEKKVQEVSAQIMPAFNQGQNNSGMQTPASQEAQGGMKAVKNPKTGKIKLIPAEQLQAAIAAGGVLVGE